MCKHCKTWYPKRCIFMSGDWVFPSSSGTEPDLVYEVEGHSSLSCAHLFRFQILVVLVADVVHAWLQLPSNLVFLPVLLSLCRMKAGNDGGREVWTKRKQQWAGGGKVRDNNRGTAERGKRRKANKMTTWRNFVWKASYQQTLFKMVIMTWMQAVISLNYITF